jgi:hypothetical protein
MPCEVRENSLASSATMLTARRGAADCGQYREAAGAFAAAQFLARDYVRHGSFRNHRVVCLVSNHRGGNCDSDSKTQK